MLRPTIERYRRERERERGGGGGRKHEGEDKIGEKCEGGR